MSLFAVGNHLKSRISISTAEGFISTPNGSKLLSPGEYPTVSLKMLVRSAKKLLAQGIDSSVWKKQKKPPSLFIDEND